MLKENKKTENSYSAKCEKLCGDITVPGDKSISHRSLLFASQAIGQSKISGLLEGEDVLATANALRSMGVEITTNDDSAWLVNGVGVGGLQAPDNVLDMGNAGTGVRLMMGLISSYDFSCIFTGDASLRSRPMGRVMNPLEQMGVEFESKEGGRLPLTVKGSSEITPITYELPVASAQVKSAILLAGLNCRGNTTVIEPIATRDHTELMLTGFGADINVIVNEFGAREIAIKGQPELKPMDIEVPGDPSSAAFLIVAALIVPDSEITIRNICMNPLRTGLFDSLQEMGADIKFTNEKVVAGEKVADIVAKYSKLKGVKIPASRAPSMIDEYPILSVAASYAQGETVMEGLEELKVKESDRLQAIADGLQQCGVEFELGDDSLTIKGGAVKGGGPIKTNLDHRIAMSFLVMGLNAQTPVSVDDASVMDTSFPGFAALLNSIGGNVNV